MNKNEEEDKEDTTNFGNEEDTVDYQYGEDAGSKVDNEIIEKFKRNYESSFDDVVMYEGQNQNRENKEISALGSGGRSESKKMKSTHDGDADEDGASGRDGINGSRSNMGGSSGESSNGCEYGSRSGGDKHEGLFSAHDLSRRVGSHNQNQNILLDGAQSTSTSISKVSHSFRQSDNMSNRYPKDMSHNNNNSVSHSEVNFGSSFDTKKRDSNTNDLNSNFRNGTNSVSRSDNGRTTGSGSSSNNSYSSSSSGNGIGDYDRQYGHSHTQSHIQSHDAHNNDSNHSGYNNDRNESLCREEIVYRNINSSVHGDLDRNRCIDTRNDCNNNGNGESHFNNGNIQNNGNSEFSSSNDYYNKPANSNLMRNINSNYNENGNGNRAESVNQHALRGITTDNRNDYRLSFTNNHNNNKNNSNGVVRNDHSSNSDSNSSSSHTAQWNQTAQFADGNKSRNHIPEKFFDAVKRTDLPDSETVLRGMRKDPPNSHAHSLSGTSCFNTAPDTNINMNMNINTERNKDRDMNMKMNMNAKQTSVRSGLGENVRFNYDNSGNRVTRHKVHGPDMAAAGPVLAEGEWTSSATGCTERKAFSSAIDSQGHIHLYAEQNHAPIGTIECSEGNHGSGQHDSDSAFFETSNSAPKSAMTSTLLGIDNHHHTSLGAKRKKERSAD
jgi:hypothetical protein